MRPSTIALGSTGSDVELWQKTIGVPVTGTFDAETDAATRAWQRHRGLDPDGVVGGKTWGAAGLASEELLPVLRTVITPADYVRSVFRCGLRLGLGRFSEPSIAVLYAQWMIETGGSACFNYNIGNAKHFKGDGFDYHMLNGVWEGVSHAEAERLIARGEAIADTNPSHLKAVGAPARTSVIFVPPHPQTWFRAFRTLDQGMSEHLELLHRRFSKAWPSVLAGDVDGFAQALKAQGYFTADAGAYAAGMKPAYVRLVASTTYEELVATLDAPQETIEVDTPAEEAIAWDRDGELAKLVSVMHQGASNLIAEDDREAFLRRPMGD